MSVDGSELALEESTVVLLRLARALVELAHANNLATLAFDPGFSSHSHFTATFRRAFGDTPSNGPERVFI